LELRCTASFEAGVADQAADFGEQLGVLGRLQHEADKPSSGPSAFAGPSDLEPADEVEHFIRPDQLSRSWPRISA
jgi:hypothetical protein